MIKHNSTSLNFISKRIKKKTKISLQKTATWAKYALLSFSAQPNQPLTTQEIKDEILAKIQATRARGARDITVRSGELQTEWGLKNKLPPICDAMKSLFRPGDRIQELPKNRTSGAKKQINTHGSTFEQQSNGQQYRGGRLEVVYLTKTDGKE